MSDVSPYPHRILSLVAGVFGAVTIFAASVVLFGPVYILAAILLWRGHRGARALAFALRAPRGAI